MEADREVPVRRALGRGGWRAAAALRAIRWPLLLRSWLGSVCGRLPPSQGGRGPGVPVTSSGAFCSVK